MSDTLATSQPQKRNIFDIDAEIDQIAMAFDQFSETGEEGAVLDAIENYFGDLLHERDRKIDGYCRLIDEYLARSEARKKESERIAILAKTDNNNAARLKSRLKFYFEQNGITKFETAFHKVSIAKNGGVQPLTVSSDVEEDPFLLPEGFRKIVVTVDKDAIRKELAKPEEEQDITVARYCILEERGTSLRIK